MTQGTYRRCATFRCKKKALSGKDHCKQHEDERLLVLIAANPNLADMITAVVDDRLRSEGLID